MSLFPANRHTKNGRSTVQLEPSKFYFGPDTGERTIPVPERRPDEEAAAANQASTPKSFAGARKHARESGPSGAPDHAPAPKRSRKSAAANGLERNVGDQPSQPSPQPPALQNGDNDNNIIPESERMNGIVQLPVANGLHSRAQSPMPVEADAEADAEMGSAGPTDMDQGMEVDTGIGAAEVQDQEQMMEQPAPAPIIYTLTNGHSVGVETMPAAKVADLRHASRILGVADGEHVTQTMWRPHDSSILAASGESVCGMWRLSNDNFGSDAKQPIYRKLIDPSDGSVVSAAAWEPRGSMLAIATYSSQDSQGQLRIFDAQNNGFLDALPGSQKAVTSLQWQSIGSKLVGFACDVQESTLLLWDLSAPEEALGPMSTGINDLINDAHWASHGSSSIICAAGNSGVYQYRALNDLAFERKWISNADNGEPWTFVRCSWPTEDSVIVIAAAAQTASLWIPSKDVYKANAHQDAITALELRPNQMSHAAESSAHEFATSSMDSTIKVWRFDIASNQLETLRQIYMGPSCPVMALAYSRDGVYVAGGSYDQLKIWKVDSSANAPPVAQWSGEDSEWRGTSLKLHDQVMNGSDSGIAQEIENFQSLSWDTNGMKLAFGLGSQVCIVPFWRYILIS